MNKQNIHRMIRARKNCISNAEMLLWGSDTGFPSFEDIKKAGILLDMAKRIDEIIDEAIKAV